MNKSTIALLSFLFVSCCFIVAAQTDVINLQDWVKVEIVSPLESNGAIPINIQDQHTPIVIAKFSQTHDSTTLASPTVINDRTINITNASGFVVGDYITLFNPEAVRFSLFTATGVSGNIITLDTPLDFNYSVGTFVDAGITNLAVDGSITPQIFGLRGSGAPEGVELSFDVTRIIFTMITTDPIDLSLFGDLTELDNGLVLRKRDGVYNNIFNVKSNREVANMLFDFTPYVATNPSHGENGYIARMTFGGQSKMGVTIRLDTGDDLEMLVQDALNEIQGSSQIIIFEVIAEGHIVTD